MGGRNKGKLRVYSANNGTTLVELMIATFIFGFLSLLLLGILNFGTRTWRNVEARSSVETDVRKAVMDMNKEIRGTIIESVVAGSNTSKYPSEGPVSYLCFASLTRESDSDCLRVWGYNTDNYQDANRYTIYSKLGGLPQDLYCLIKAYNRWVLYYAVRPANHNTKYGICQKDEFNDVNPIYKCPHKILIKKEIFANIGGGFSYSGYTFGTINQKYPKGYWGGTYTKWYMNPTDIEKHLTKAETLAGARTADVNGTTVMSVTVLARNVLVFLTNFRDTITNRGDSNLSAPEVQYTLRCFKILEYGKADGTKDLYGLPPSMSVQIDSKTIPFRDEGGTIMYKME